MRSRTQQDAAILYMYTQGWIQRIFPGEREAENIVSVQINNDNLKFPKSKREAIWKIIFCPIFLVLNNDDFKMIFWGYGSCFRLINGFSMFCKASIWPFLKLEVYALFHPDISTRLTERFNMKCVDSSVVVPKVYFAKYTSNTRQSFFSGAKKTMHCLIR